MNTATNEENCKCSHCYYDHIGFRGHLEGEARLRTSCRIVSCGCDAYNEIMVGTNITFKQITFNPAHTYGEEFPYVGSYNNISQAIKDKLHQKAKAILPPKQYYELRGSISRPYGQDKRICWIYEPEMDHGDYSECAADLNPIVLVCFTYNYYIIGGYHA